MRLSRLRIVRPHGDAFEAISDDGQGPRVTAWPGAPPPRPPKHRSLARPIDGGLLQLEQGPYWMELRPPGALVSELSGLSLPEVGLMLLNVAEALTALHGGGLVHGAVDADHVVIAPGGRAVLIGVGEQPGTADDDIHGLRMMMAALWPETATAPPPDPGSEPAEVHVESLSGWLDCEFPDHSSFSLGSRSLHAAPPLPDDAPMLDALVIDREDEGLDEVGVNLGPDGERGLLDPWTTGTGNTATGTKEITGSEGDAPPQKVALVGRLMSPPDRDLDPERFAGREADAARALKGLIADEPLDPVPTPSGVPLPAPDAVDLPDDPDTLPWADIDDDGASEDEPSAMAASPRAWLPWALLAAGAALLLGWWLG
ncbi:MAG: hypothetical protein H6739_23215 [Alphaproteobacteria bacterium]|nr:hypothetical protein [Alphaproteobacteria bacterium]